ncbi:MAG: sigma-70 family RNA polymerase sigma factor [Phycisphaerae bacterium]
MDAETGYTTMLLDRIRSGDAQATEELLPIVYSHLRDVAGAYFRRQPKDLTLQPTALVHEAFLKLMNAADTDWKSKAHFCAVAATAMRQILQDHARKRLSEKRGGEYKRIPLTNVEKPQETEVVDSTDLEAALERLFELDPQQARVVELRFLGGLTIEQVAHVMNLSVRTVDRYWQHARLWLRRELQKPS